MAQATIGIYILKLFQFFFLIQNIVGCLVDFLE